MLKRCLCAALLSVVAQYAAAQDQISPDAFLDQAVGKTLTFEGFRSGRQVGVEQFLRRDLSVWTDVSGRCTYGTIEIRGPQLCFIYDDSPDPENCWLIFEYEEDLLVMSSREVQRISRIEERDLNCSEAPLS